MVSLVLPSSRLSSSQPFPTPAHHPVTPTQRPKTLKRDSSYLTPPSYEDEKMAGVKRQRVAFSDDIDVHHLSATSADAESWYADAGTARTPALIDEEVRVALEVHARRGADQGAYEAVRAVFVAAAVDKKGEPRADGYTLDIADGAGSTRSLALYVAALRKRVGELKGCHSLITAVLDVNWIGRGEEFVELYVNFLGALGSAMPGALKGIMERIVRFFTELPSSLGRLEGEPLVRKRQMLANLHFALTFLVRLVPAAMDVLADTLKSQFPNHRTTEKQEFLAYIRNLFKVSTYAPDLLSDVLSLLTERMVKIDVEIQQEMEDLEDELEGDVIEAQQATDNYFLDDDTSDDSDAESDVSSEYDETPEQKQLKSLRDRTAKLDAGMDFLFKHYSTMIQADNTTTAFEPLLALFNTFVLPTYRSRHVQFLVFHFAQLDLAKTSYFINHLVRNIQTHNPTSTLSRSATAYLASFLARGSRIPRSVMRDVASFLIHRINTLRTAGDKSFLTSPDLARYPAFYSSTQALLYTFCFRWRELLFNTNAADSDADEQEFIYLSPATETTAVRGLTDCLSQAIHSRLNPLRVCSASVVKQFAAIANHIEYMFLLGKLEANKKVRLMGGGAGMVRGGGAQGLGQAMSLAGRGSALSARRGEEHCVLEPVFPFDPYRLPRSGRWIGDEYGQWRGIVGLRLGEEDEESEDDEEDDEEEDEGEQDDAESGSDSESDDE